MIFRLCIDPSREESITASVHRRTPLVDEIERLVLQDSVTESVMGYRGEEIVRLPLCEIESFSVENEKTYAHCTDKQRYLVKKRLYELEEVLPSDFVKINKSAIANWQHVVRLKVQLSGAVDAVFQSGYQDCISRRRFSELKRRFGL